MVGLPCFEVVQGPDKYIEVDGLVIVLAIELDFTEQTGFG